MITIIPELWGTSLVSPYYCGVASIVPTSGFAIPAYADGLRSSQPKSRRCLSDFISTGRAGAFGDRDCEHFQVSGTVHMPSLISGGVLDWNSTIGIPSAQNVAPSDLGGYSYPQLKAAWGTASRSTLNVYKYRVQGPGKAFSANPSYPISLSSVGGGKAYGACNGPNKSSHFIAQEAAYAFRTYYAGPGRVGVFSVNAYWQTQWNTTGSSSVTSFTASAAFVVYGPSVSGGSDYKTWTPNPNGTWSPTTSSLVLPPFLQTCTRSAFLGFLADPTLLVSWIPPGLSSLASVPNWSSAANVPAQYWAGTIVAQSPMDQENVDALQTAIAEYFAPLTRLLACRSDIDDWQDLGDTAADNILQTSVNHYANAMQLSKTLETLRATLMLTKSWKSPEAWAHWWLSFRYGDRLTCQDAAEDVNAVVSEVKSRTTGWSKDFYTSKSQSHTTITCPQTRIPPAKVDHYLKLYYNFIDYGWFGKAYVFGRKWSLWPTTAAGWDIIPFSFVVDWIVDVQSLFEEFDRDTFLQYIKVLSVIQTEKKTYDFGDIVLNGFTLSGAKVTYYSRILGTRLPSGPFRIDRGHSSAVNVVDGISLIVQAH